METLIVHPVNEEQSTVIRAFLEALKIDFEREEQSPYNNEFVDKIKRGEKAAANGRGFKVDLNEI